MKKMVLRDRVCLTIATLFGVGYTPMCPGTAACVVAVLVFFLIKSQAYFFVFTLISLILSYVVSGRAEKLFGEKDCKKIVIDDFSGMLITFLFLSRASEFIFIVFGFFLFRMLDMIKIPPADKIEKFQGAKGIVGDDLVAGIYACFILQAVRFILQIVS